MFESSIHRRLERNLKLDLEFVALESPLLRRQSSRSRKARRREKEELGPIAKRKRNSIVICARCK